MIIIPLRKIKDYLIFEVTCARICEILEFNRIYPRGKE
jgi:hypothetical protein